MGDSDLSVSARRRSLRLQLERIQRKFAKVEEEITEAHCGPRGRLWSLLREGPQS